MRSRHRIAFRLREPPSITKAGDAELLARIGVRTALEQAYGKLRTAFPGQRKLVESFFYRAERQAKKASTDEPSEPAGP
jgi:hypothetical protein